MVKHSLSYIYLKSLSEYLIIYLEERLQMSDSLSSYYSLRYKIGAVRNLAFQSVLQIEMLSF